MATISEPKKGATSISAKGLKLIQQFEGLVLNAYTDQVGVYTIGWGTTRYENGQPVKKGQRITRERADELLKFEAGLKAYAIAEGLKDVTLNQNQFDAIVSLAYNIGVHGFLGSTVLKMIKINPNDPNIRKAFYMWNKGTINGKKVVLSGLTERRKKEADYYFS